jgi:carboxypeptidase C (cathepsin A)
MTPVEVVLSLLDKAWVVIVGLLWYEKRTTDLENKNRDNEITKLKLAHTEIMNQYVTEAEVREVLRETLKEYKEDQQEIKLLLKNLHDQIIVLSRDMAVQNALRSIEDEHNRSSN